MKDITRAFKAGKALGRSLKETVNLMYQDRTALHFYDGLIQVLYLERHERQERWKKQKKKDTSTKSKKKT